MWSRSCGPVSSVVLVDADLQQHYVGLMRPSAATALAAEYILTSPNYPQNYADDLECDWRVTALPANKRLLVELTDLHVESHFYGCAIFININLNSAFFWFYMLIDYNH